jgi:hypothetical protein
MTGPRLIHCPLAKGTPASSLSPGDFGDVSAVGGPVYALAFPGNNRLLFVFVPGPNNAFLLHQKWIVDRAYHDSLTITSSPYGVAMPTIQFVDDQSQAEAGFRLEAGGPSYRSGWRAFGTVALIPSRGCYEYHVNGQRLSETLSFEVD